MSSKTELLKAQGNAKHLKHRKLRCDQVKAAAVKKANST